MQYQEALEQQYIDFKNEIYNLYYLLLKTSLKQLYHKKIVQIILLQFIPQPTYFQFQAEDFQTSINNKNNNKISNHPFSQQVIKYIPYIKNLSLNIDYRLNYQSNIPEITNQIYDWIKKYKIYNLKLDLYQIKEEQYEEIAKNFISQLLTNSNINYHIHIILSFRISKKLSQFIQQCFQICKNYHLRILTLQFVGFRWYNQGQLEYKEFILKNYIFQNQNQQIIKISKSNNNFNLDQQNYGFFEQQIQYFQEISGILISLIGLKNLTLDLSNNILGQSPIILETLSKLFKKLDFLTCLNINLSNIHINQCENNLKIILESFSDLLKNPNQQLQKFSINLSQNKIGQNPQNSYFLSKFISTLQQNNRNNLKHLDINIQKNDFGINEENIKFITKDLNELVQKCHVKNINVNLQGNKLGKYPQNIADIQNFYETIKQSNSNFKKLNIDLSHNNLSFIDGNQFQNKKNNRSKKKNKNK